MQGRGDRGIEEWGRTLGGEGGWVEGRRGAIGKGHKRGVVT
jgi:hypothetical protein